MSDPNVIDKLIELSDDFLTCPICYEKFVEPRTLPCLHTLYTTCLAKGLAPNVHSKCPICNKLLVIAPAHGDLINQFPINFTLVELSDRLHGIINSQFERESDRMPNLHCRNCIDVQQSHKFLHRSDSA